MSRAVIRQGTPCRKCGCTDRYLPKMGKQTGACVACSKACAKRQDEKRKEQRASGIYRVRIRKEPQPKMFREPDDARPNDLMAHYLAKAWTAVITYLPEQTA